MPQTPPVTPPDLSITPSTAYVRENDVRISALGEGSQQVRVQRGDFRAPLVPIGIPDSGLIFNHKGEALFRHSPITDPARNQP